MRFAAKTFILILFLSNFLICFPQGKVDQSKSELKKDNRKKNSNENNQSYSSSSFFEDDGDESLGLMILQGFCKVLFVATVGIYGEEEHLNSSLTPYPYYNKISGNFESIDSVNSLRLFRLDIENNFLINPDNVYGDHLKLKIRPFQYFYFQTDYFQLVEDNERHNSYSYLSLFNFNFCYDRLRFEKFNLGWTMGLNYIANDVNKAGFSVGFNTEIFISKPISLNSSIKWSSINHLPVNEFEAHLKYHIHRGFITLGYEHLKIATPVYNFMSVGLGVYFL